MRQLEARAIVPEHGRGAATDSAIVELHVRVRTEGAKDIGAFLVAQAPEIQFVVGAKKIHPLAVLRNLRQRRICIANRLRLFAGHRQPEMLVHEEIEDDVNAVALAEVHRHLVRREVRFRHEDRVAAMPGQYLPHLNQVFRTVAECCAARDLW